MKFNEHWLRTLVDIGLDTVQLGELLTMAGLEVEQCDAVAPPFAKGRARIADAGRSRMIAA